MARMSPRGARLKADGATGESSGPLSHGEGRRYSLCWNGVGVGTTHPLAATLYSCLLDMLVFLPTSLSRWEVTRHCICEIKSGRVMCSRQWGEGRSAPRQALLQPAWDRPPRSSDALWMVGSAGLSSGAEWCGARLQPVHPWTNTWPLLKATGVWGCLLLQEHLFFMNDTSFFFNIQVTAFPTFPPCCALRERICDLR